MFIRCCRCAFVCGCASWHRLLIWKFAKPFCPIRQTTNYYLITTNDLADLQKTFLQRLWIYLKILRVDVRIKYIIYDSCSKWNQIKPAINQFLTIDFLQVKYQLYKLKLYVLTFWQSQGIIKLIYAEKISYVDTVDDFSLNFAGKFFNKFSNMFDKVYSFCNFNSQILM